jgi:LysR family nitrogen assimilation transcriptional regulator
VAALEAETGARLLLRLPRGMAPTAAGRVLYEHARAVLRRLEQAREEVRAAAGAAPAGTVSIGMPLSTSNVLALPLMLAARAALPKVVLQINVLQSSDIPEMVMSARLDLALLFPRGEMRGLRVEPLLEEDLLWLPPGGPEAASPDPVPLAALREVPMLLPRRPNGLRERVERAFARIGAEPRLVAEIDALPAIWAAAAEGIGAVVPWAAVNPAGGGSRARTVRIADAPELRRSLAVCDAGDAALSATVLAVRALLVSQVSSIVLGGCWRGVRLSKSVLQIPG